MIFERSEPISRPRLGGGRGVGAFILPLRCLVATQ